MDKKTFAKLTGMKLVQNTVQSGQLKEDYSMLSDKDLDKIFTENVCKAIANCMYKDGLLKVEKLEENGKEVLRYWIHTIDGDKLFDLLGPVMGKLNDQGGEG